MRDADRRCVLGLSLMKALHGNLTRLLLARRDPASLYRALVPELSSEWGLSETLARRIVAERSAVDLDRESQRLEDSGARIVCVLDPDYPAALASTPSPPAVLYVKGKMPEGPAVAVVGSRKASAYGLATAEKIARELAEAHVTVVSGFALGIDHAAHKAALDAGGTTIAVMGNGVDICYPRRHAALVPRLMEAGCFVSEFSLGTPPLAQNFPARNRIISGLSLATVIVEAAANSGSLYTADFALAQGREVLAVPGSIYSPTCEGTNALLADGAGPARCAGDVFDTIGLEAPERTAARRERLSEREAGLVKLLGAEALTVEELVARSSKAAEEISTALTLLEIKGIVRRGFDQRFVLVSM